MAHKEIAASKNYTPTWEGTFIKISTTSFARSMLGLPIYRRSNLHMRERTGSLFPTMWSL